MKHLWAGKSSATTLNKHRYNNSRINKGKKEGNIYIERVVLNRL